MPKSDKKFDILVAGEINPDLIVSDPKITLKFGQNESIVEDVALTIGSSSAIFACGAAKLGLRVAFIGVVGNDEFGKFMLESLKERHVDISNVIYDQDIKTGLSVILNRGEDRAILTYLGTIDKLREDDVSNELLEECRHLHVASYFLQNRLRLGLPKLFSRAKDLGLTISLDTNWDPDERWEGLNKVLPMTDVFLPNRNELLSLTRTQSVDDALDEITKLVPLATVKLGAEGAIASNGKVKIQASPPPIDEIADTVGAGDTFDAGFIYGYLSGWKLERTVKLAVACGSLSLRKHGGTAAQPTLEEAERVAGLN